MKVRRLEVESFRGIGSVSITLDPRLTVFVGENGVGKTSILDAIAILLDNYVARWLRGSGQSAERLRDSDAKIGGGVVRLRIEVEDETGLRGEWVLRKQQRVEKILRPAGSELDGLNAFVRRRVEMHEDVSGSPLLIYYGQRRAVLDLPRRIRAASKQAPEAAFTDALKLGDLNFREFVAWFRDRSLAESQQWRKNRDHTDIELDAVRRAMTKATGLTEPTYRVGTPSGLCFLKGGIELRIDQLSSGERSFLSLAGDLARRLAMLNPNAADPLKGSGIVLVDEVELHLHPRWQRRFVPWFLKTFPNCQFILTTHSPQVLGEVSAENIRILEQSRGQVVVSEPAASLGRDSNYILLSVLGSTDRDDQVGKLLLDFDKQIASELLDQAETTLSAVERLIEGSPPELTLARSRLNRLQRAKGN